VLDLIENGGAFELGQKSPRIFLGKAPLVDQLQ